MDSLEVQNNRWHCRVKSIFTIRWSSFICTIRGFFKLDDWFEMIWIQIYWGDSYQIPDHATSTFQDFYSKITTLCGHCGFYDVDNISNRLSGKESLHPPGWIHHVLRHVHLTVPRVAAGMEFFAAGNSMAKTDGKKPLGFWTVLQFLGLKKHRPPPLPSLVSQAAGETNCSGAAKQVGGNQ